MTPMQEKPPDPLVPVAKKVYEYEKKYQGNKKPNFVMPAKKLPLEGPITP